MHNKHSDSQVLFLSFFEYLSAFYLICRFVKDLFFYFLIHSVIFLLSNHVFFYLFYSFFSFSLYLFFASLLFFYFLLFSNLFVSSSLFFSFFFSEHSQCEELIEFVTFLRPKEILPTVFTDVRTMYRTLHFLFYFFYLYIRFC